MLRLKSFYLKKIEGSQSLLILNRVITLKVYKSFSESKYELIINKERSLLRGSA